MKSITEALILGIGALIFAIMSMFLIHWGAVVYVATFFAVTNQLIGALLRGLIGTPTNGQSTNNGQSTATGPVVNK